MTLILQVSMPLVFEMFWMGFLGAMPIAFVEVGCSLAYVCASLHRPL